MQAGKIEYFYIHVKKIFYVARPVFLVYNVRMRSRFFLILCAVALLSACASANYVQEGNFRVYSDDVTGVVETVHNDLVVGSFYNLRDNIFGERENIRVVLENNFLFLSVMYQYKNFGYFTDAVIIANGERLQIPLTDRKTHIGSGFVRENYATLLTSETAADIRRMMQSENCAVAFLGDYTTDKMSVSAKIRAAIVETIDYYLERL